MNSNFKTKPKSKLRLFFRVTLFAFVFALLLIVSELLIFSQLLDVTHYRLTSDKVNTAFTVALITDHHGSRYGTNQDKLLMLIEAGKPDIILLAGDIFCSVNDTVEARVQSHALIAGAVAIAPTYFVSGNHERANPEYDMIRQEIRDLGAIVLQNEITELTVKGNRVILAGSNEIGVFIPRAPAPAHISRSEAFTILMTHYPEQYSHYSDYGFDVIMAGHAHGGQVRIPLFAPNGLYAPGQGRFPLYTGGDYKLSDESGGGCLIVSRGLSRVQSGRYRIFNRPELVFIEVSS